MGFLRWLYRWKWTGRVSAYVFCVTLLSFFIPAYVQLAIGELSFGAGTFLVMIWMIPAILYGFYLWGNKSELRLKVTANADTQ
jgi:hypothetical protein